MGRRTGGEKENPSTKIIHSKMETKDDKFSKEEKLQTKTKKQKFQNDTCNGKKNDMHP